MHPRTSSPLGPACLLAAASALSVSAVARAGASPEATAAEMLDAEGTALVQAHRYAEACPKLAESHRLQPGTGVLLRLGLCYELLGKTKAAWSAFHDAAARAKQSGDESLRQLATKRADAVAPRVPRVVLALAAGDESAPIAVSCDGVPIERAALGAPIPLDPGMHRVEATRAHASFARTFMLPARSDLVTIPLELQATGGAAGGASHAPRGEERALALVLAGVGVTGLVVGSVFGVAALTTWNRARSECTSGTAGCSPDALSLQSVVRSDAQWSTVGFVGGGASLVGAAVVWWLAGRSPGAPSSACVVGPTVGARGLGLEMRARF